MGTNVIQLADYLVPSYRRPRHERTLAGHRPSGLSGSWSAMARERAAAKHLASVREPDPAAGTTPGVRVTHLVGGGPASPRARLRISGRLIDVCAELDRLAAAEAEAQLPRRA